MVEWLSVKDERCPNFLVPSLKFLRMPNRMRKLVPDFAWAVSLASSSLSLFGNLASAFSLSSKQPVLLIREEHLAGNIEQFMLLLSIHVSKPRRRSSILLTDRLNEPNIFLYDMSQLQTLCF